MFNEKAAKWAHDLVMKMDPAEAEVLVPMVMSDVWNNDVRSNKRVINGLVARIHKSMLDVSESLVSKGMMDKEGVAEVIGDSLQSMLVSDYEPLVDIAKYNKEWGYRDSSGKFSSIDELSGIGRNSYDKKEQKRYKKRIKRFKQYEKTFVNTNRGGLDLASAVGAAPKTRAGLGAVDSQTPEFQRQWTRAAHDTQGSSSAPTYRRVQAGGQALGAIGAATGNSHVALAGAMGSFAGQYGPEAEKVIGPSVRRAAYRYRGVEKKPSEELVESVNEAVRIGIAYGTDPDSVPDETKRSITRQGAMRFMSRQIPQTRLSEIQRKSGRITPSEGVIITSDGQVTAQSFGHADDHYLPFNLKNLSKLKDGEYVRTRTTGGLTSEDIYTGLMSGAKRVTVVSNSGVFSVEFEDDLKGIRRYGDKAHSMIGRYQKTLDTIRNGKLERIGVSDEVKSELLDEAEDEMPPSAGYSRADIHRLYQQKVDEYKNSPTLTNGEMETISAAAKEASGGDERAYKVMRTKAINDAIEAKEQRIYRLDGDGYSTALDAMKEQYPYFIKKVTYASRNERATEQDGRLKDPEKLKEYREGVKGTFVASTDAGYVKPKHNRPEDVLDGYYDPSIAGEGKSGIIVPGSKTDTNPSGTVSGKTKADITDYQNWPHNPLNPNVPKAKKDKEEGEKATPAKPQTQGQRAAAGNAWQAKNNQAAADALYQATVGIPPETLADDKAGASFPGLKSMPVNLDDRKAWAANAAKDPKQRAQLASELESFAAIYGQGSSAAEAMSRKAKELRGSIPADAEWNGKQFTEAGHQPGADQTAVDKARQKATTLTTSLRPFFGDDTGAALKFAKEVDKAITSGDPAEMDAVALNLEDSKRQQLLALVRKNPDIVKMSAEGYARLKHLDSIHGGSPDPKAPSASAPTTSSTAPTSPSTSNEVATEQPKVSPAPKSEDFENVLKDLDRMVGHQDIKREVRTMANYLNYQRARKEAGLDTDNVGSHMVFVGNPGTGKTSVARMIGRLYAAAGLLPSGHVVETGRSGLVGEYAGQTAPKVDEAVNAAIGGVLFVDEAYTLSEDKYGQEAIDQLMTRMENDRGKFVVIAAGYDKNMDKFLTSNPGLESRFNSRIKFTDYSPEELGQIFTSFAAKDGYKLTDDAKEQMVADLNYLHDKRGENFANGREVRNYWDNVRRARGNRFDDEQDAAQAAGLDYNPDAEDLATITRDDMLKLAPIPKKQPKTLPKAKIARQPVGKRLILTPVR